MKRAGEHLREIGRRLDRAGAFFMNTAPGRAVLAALLLAVFLSGYGMTSDVVRQCGAWPVEYDYEGSANVGSSTCAIPCPPTGFFSLCDVIEEGEAARQGIKLAYEEAMESTAENLEKYISTWLIDGMMTALLEKLNQNEIDLIDWWDTFWFYNLYPALQDMTKQLSVSLADQVRTLQSGGDGKTGGEVSQAKQSEDIDAQEEFSPSENVGVAATLIGGQERAISVGIAMRQSWQDQALALGMAKSSTPAAAGLGAAGQARHDRYEKTFCDPDSNGGFNTCNGADPKNYNVDTQVTRQVYNRLTLDIEGASGP